MRKQILIIDDDVNFLADTKLLLKNDFDCITSETIAEGIEKVRNLQPDAILLDLMLKNNENGLEGIKLIRAEDSDVPIIMITDFSSIETAIKAIKLGAFEYLPKSIRIAELKLVIHKAFALRDLKIRTESIEKEITNSFREIVGESEPIKKLKEKIQLFASNDSTILVTGESGVGKELVTRQIHQNSNRKNEPLVVVNCAAIPKDLIESELFGHEKGAFTGADKRKIGKFELADSGTIFLDEISELDLQSQVSLLRVLQEREFQRVGGIREIRSNCRVIAATNKNLKQMVDDNLFREDLYYRLDVLPIQVPPLRERRDDIIPLTKHFLKVCANDLKIKYKQLSHGSVELLKNYNWPGNVRELSNVVTRAILLSQFNEEVDFTEVLSTQKATPKIPDSWENMLEMRKEAANNAAREIEEIFINQLLQKHNGNITEAAKAINVDRTTLHKLIKRIKDIYEN